MYCSNKKGLSVVKKLYSNQLNVVLFIVAIMPIKSMEKTHNSNGVKFNGIDSIIVVPQCHLKLMGAWWANHYKKYKNDVDAGQIIPRFEHVSPEGLRLVKDAMSVDVDKFADFYIKLSPENKRLLINVSGEYGNTPQEMMLNISSLTAQLVEVYFTQDLRKYIKSYCEDDIKNEVFCYFKSQIFKNKSSKRNMLFPSEDPLLNCIPYRSVWVPYNHTISLQDNSLSLSVNGINHAVYASYFATDTHECRLVDRKDNICSLWVIDHKNLKNKNHTFLTPISHNKPIKGSCFGKTETGNEYVVTYSECDIVITKINRGADISLVETVHKVLPKNCKVVDVCINLVNNHLIVGMYQEYNSRIDIWSMEGKLLKEGTPLLSFENNGLLKKILMVYNDSDKLFLSALFIVGGQYSICRAESLGSFDYDSLMNGGRCNYYSATRYDLMFDGYSDYNVYKNGNDLLIYSTQYCLRSRDIKPQSFTWANFIEKYWSLAGRQHYYVYSPSGKFLMRNSFKTKYEIGYIETILKDSITHKTLLTIDTLYTSGLSSFTGVGFTHNEQELIFLNSSGSHDSVSLLNDDDANILQKIENKASANIAIAALLRRLCRECKKNGSLNVDQNDPACRMLLQWSRESSEMLNFLEKCLPLRRTGLK